MSDEINIVDRENAKEMTEKVYGQWFLSLLYNSFPGKILAPFFTNKIFSKIYGSLQDLPLSQSKYESFIKNFDIKMEEYILDHPDEKVPFKTFNDFFIRQFKENARPFPKQDEEFPAFSEGRYLIYDEINDKVVFPIKGHYLGVQQILENKELAEKFEGGPLIVSRLCPVDYHRFHFPDNGKIVQSYRTSGKLNSVNPIALKHSPKLYFENERHITIMETNNFGTLAYIEVGAICVGKIIQNYKGNDFSKGQEKGYFLFGGSTVLLFAQKGKLSLDQDILDNTKNHKETFIKLGSRIGQSSTV